MEGEGRERKEERYGRGICPMKKKVGACGLSA